jgi:predicted nucleic acid-binding protein
MAFLLDTNVYSELLKGQPRCNPRVWAWYEAADEDELYLSVLVLGEMRQGVERRRRKDLVAARSLEKWLHETETLYRRRIIPVTQEICDIWGRLAATTPIPVVDCLMAATAVHLNLIVVTRNVRDFQRCGVDFINPFED